MTSARELARCYDQYVFALWRGESDEVRRFATWLKSFWDLGAPAEPTTPPDAISAYGGAGAGIRWHESGGMIFGYIPGVLHRCYQISTLATPPAYTLVSIPRSSADTPPAPKFPPPASAKSEVA